LLGTTTVSSAGIVNGEQKVAFYKLKSEPKKYKKDKEQRGEVCITWKYNDRKLKTDNGNQSFDSPIKKSKLIEDVYKIGREIGVGAFSVVKEGVHRKTGKKVAIKILENYGKLEDAEEELDAFKNETTILLAPNHKAIVNLLGIYEDAANYFVVMELVEGGELFDEIIEKETIAENRTKDIVKQLLSALEHVHSHGYVHRDIKPENILFTSQERTHVKIVDFGEAKPCKIKLTEYVGTPDYMAPEVLKGHPYDSKVDLWSLGVVVYIMLSGFPPFEGENEAQVLVNIMNIKYNFDSPEWKDISNEAKDFIQKLMCPQEKRLDATEMSRHPWLL